MLQQMDTPLAADHPTPRRWGRWRASDVVGVLAALLAVLGAVSYPLRGAPLEQIYASWVAQNAPLGIVGSLAMAVALRQQPGNRAARFLFASSVLSALHVATLAAANWLAAMDPSFTLVGATGVAVDLGTLPPLAGGLFWVSTWIWVPAAALAMLYGAPLLPDGRWPSPRWRRVEPVAAVAATSFALSWAIYLWPGGDATIAYAELPRGAPLVDALFWAGGLGIAGCAVVAIAAVVVRLRRADDEHSRQLRSVGVMVLLALVLMVALYPWQAVWALAVAVLLSALAATIALAMTRHRLFDVEVLVSRAVTAALLAAFVAVAYVGIVVGIGYLLGDRDNLGLALVATAVVAVAFEPLRRRVTRWTRRLVLGTRSTPAEVLGQLSDGLAGAASTDDVLVRVAELLVAGTGAERAEVHTAGRLAAVAGDRTEARAATTATTATTSTTRSMSVTADGTVLGEVVLRASRSDLLLPADEALLGRVAALLGPVLRNAALASELQRTVDELQASRQRLVLAEESVRRSVERDIHDGAQQRLLSLRLKLGLATTLADQGEVDRVTRVVAEAASDTEAAIRGLRNLARGLHPPVLDQEGLVAALRSHLRQVPIDTRVTAPDDLPRLDAGVEAALYLCCLEAVQNVTKHAEATTVTIRLTHDGTTLALEVADDGRGFDEAEPGVGLHSIRDRVEALGGTLTISSAPGQGTCLRARVPVTARPPGEEPVAAPPSSAQSSAAGGSPVSAR